MIIYMGIVDGVNVVKLQGILTKFRPKCVSSGPNCS